MEGKLKGEAATRSAEYYIWPLKNRSVEWFYRQIGKWGDYYIQNKELIISLQGNHIKLSSLIEKEDIVMECMSWLRSQKPANITGQHFKRFIEEMLPPNETSYSKSTIAHSTSCNWLNSISFEVTDTDKKKGSIYVDDHERYDVVSYRERFCKYGFTGICQEWNLMKDQKWLKSRLNYLVMNQRLCLYSTIRVRLTPARISGIFAWIMMSKY